jgi:hypothetical protein
MVRFADHTAGDAGSDSSTSRAPAGTPREMSLNSFEPVERFSASQSWVRSGIHSAIHGKIRPSNV